MNNLIGIDMFVNLYLHEINKQEQIVKAIKRRGINSALSQSIQEYKNSTII